MTLERKDAPAIIVRLVNACWFVFKWSILAMLATVVLLGGYLYLRLDDEVRRYAEGVLAGHYSQFDVKLGSARFEAGRGIMLGNLVIHERLASGQSRVLAEVGEMQLLGPFDLEALTSGKPTVERIRIRSPRLYAARDPHGSWNIASLFPPPATGKRPADIEIVDAVVLVTDSECNPTKPLTLREVSLAAKCIQQAPAKDPAAPELRTYEIEAAVGGDVAEEFSFAGTVQTGTGLVDLQITVGGLDLSSYLVESLVRRSPQLSRVAEVAGRGDVSLVVQGQLNARPSWESQFRVTGGRVGIEGVARPLSSITAEGLATQDRLLVRQAEAKFGKAKVMLALDRRGWHPSAKLALRALANRVTVEESLLDLLPPTAHEAWSRFEPSGEVTATLAAQFDGQQWKPDLTIDCHNISFTDREKFDYRLTGGSGKLVVGDRGDGRGPVLDIQQLTASVGGTPATINGSFAGLPGLGERRSLGGEVLPPTGWLEVTGDRFPLSDSLVDALNSKVRNIVDLLDAKGRVSVDWRFERVDPMAEPHTQTELTFHNARVQFEKFPYPLANIEGKAFERDGHWRFEDLVSRDANAPREVRAAGTCTRQADGSHVLDLTFVGEQIALDDTLRLALSPKHQATWAAINPQSGRVNVTAHVAHHLGVDEQPQMHLVIRPLPQSVLIEPSCFPYGLENLQGTIVVENDQVTLDGLRAEHGPTVFETDGTWIPNASGGWQLQFNNLHVDRLTADYDLKRAAPAGIGKVIEFLKPAGTFSIHNGQVWFSRDVAGSTHLRSEWKVALGCQQNDLELGVPLKSVSGVVRLSGRHEGNRRFTAGQLDLDSVFWNGMQFTNVRGPVWVDSQECRLGRGATERMNYINGKNDPLDRVAADYYGGTLALDANVQLTNRAPYTIDLAVDKCDLARMSTDYFGGSVDLSGTMSGQATLNGMGRAIELLDGGGRMAIRNAKMYELPIMARLLKVLRLREPDKTAFTGVDAQFKVNGRYIQFEELNLLGDAVSLYGVGDVSFDRQLNLKFHSTVGRNDFNVPLLRSMIGQASANLLLIHVTGPMENAKIERAPLPVVNEFVEQLGREGVATPRPERGFWNR